MSARCTVGTEWKSAFSEFGRRVDEDHSHATGLLDSQRLVHAGVDPAIADDDLASHFRRIEHGCPAIVRCGEAQRQIGRIRSGEPRVDRIDERGRPHRRRDGSAVVRDPVSKRHRALSVAIVRARCDGRDPRARVGNRSDGRPAVPGRRGYEDARVRSEQERDLGRVAEVRQRPGDRVVDDVDTICDSRVDGSNEVGGEAARRRPVLRRPERLVGSDPRTGSHAADRPEYGSGACGQDAVVSAGRAAGVRPVPVVVTRGHELPGPLRLDSGVTAPGGVEVLSRDELLVAEVRVPRTVGDDLGGLALAMEARDLLVDELPVCVSVGEALGLRPDARVDDADDDVLAGPAESGPGFSSRPARQGAPTDRPEQSGRGMPAWTTCPPSAARRPSPRGRPGGFELRRLRFTQLCGEPVVRVRVVVELLATAGAAQCSVMGCLEVAYVLDDIR